MMLQDTLGCICKLQPSRIHFQVTQYIFIKNGENKLPDIPREYIGPIMLNTAIKWPITMFCFLHPVLIYYHPASLQSKRIMILHFGDNPNSKMQEDLHLFTIHQGIKLTLLRVNQSCNENIHPLGCSLNNGHSLKTNRLFVLQETLHL